VYFTDNGCLIITDDFNNDSLSDIVVANSTTINVGIFVGFDKT
jgi:hypothetical protein